MRGAAGRSGSRLVRDWRAAARVPRGAGLWPCGWPARVHDGGRPLAQCGAGYNDRTWTAFLRVLWSRWGEGSGGVLSRRSTARTVDCPAATQWPRCREWSMEVYRLWISTCGGGSIRRKSAGRLRLASQSSKLTRWRDRRAPGCRPSATRSAPWPTSAASSLRTRWGWLSALTRKFGDAFGRRTRWLLAASRRPSGAETARCLSSKAGACAVAAWTLACSRKHHSRAKATGRSGRYSAPARTTRRRSSALTRPPDTVYRRKPAREPASGPSWSRSLIIRETRWVGVLA